MRHQEYSQTQRLVSRAWGAHHLQALQIRTDNVVPGIALVTLVPFLEETLVVLKETFLGSRDAHSIMGVMFAGDDSSSWLSISIFWSRAVAPID
jgi:hypothetical protein